MRVTQPKPLEHDAAAPSPATLRWAVRLLLAQAVVAGGYAGYLLYEDLTADVRDTTAALYVTGYFVAFAALLVGLALALRRHRRWARGPAVFLELMLLPIGYFAALAGWLWIGVGVIALSLICAGLLLAPASRAALGFR